MRWERGVEKLTVEDWLDGIASGTSGSPRSAVAALEVAAAAGLLERVCARTIEAPEGRPRYGAAALSPEDRETVLATARRSAAGVREQALRLAEAGDGEAAAGTASAAARVLNLAGEVQPDANVNVLPDVVVAASTARAALEAAAISMEASRATTADPAAQSELDRQIASIRTALVRAEATIAAIRAQINR